MDARADSVVLTKAEVRLKAVYLISIWMETLLYGLYLFLFVGAFSVLLRKEVRKPFAAKVFLVGNGLMFMSISFHNWLNLYRLVIAFAYQTDIRSPLSFLNDISGWSCFATPILLGVTVFVGDILLIYRCFLIWQRSYWVIAFPCLLYVVTVAVQSVNFWWISHQSNIVGLLVTRWPFLNTTYPMYLAQNLLTTGLILSKIWSRYRATKAAGTVPLHTPSLVSLMRVMIESAALYTASMFVMVILRALDHPDRLVPHFMLYPTIGITFVLMAIRVHAVREEAKQTLPSPSKFMPSWLFAIEGEVDTKDTSMDMSSQQTKITSGATEHSVP